MNLIVLAFGIGYSKEKSVEEDTNFTISILLIAFFVFACFQPCIPIFYRTARIELMKSIGNIIIAPFGSVRFRDFFLADVITSMKGPLGDLGLIVLLLRDGTEANKKDIGWYFTIVSVAPYWWRFW